MNTYLRSFLGGVCISLGCIAYLSVDNKLFGACLFSVGLYCILKYNLLLYTGRVGLVQDRCDALRCVSIFLGNGAGCACTMLCTVLSGMYEKLREPLWTLANAKLNTPIHELFMLGVFCGVLMLFATKTRSVQSMIPMLCVAAFILMGAEHSIADAFYCTVLGVWGWFRVVIPVALGNAAGAIVVNKMMIYTKI